MLSSRAALWFALGVGALAILARVLPHAPNFVPIGALALFAGARLPKRWGFVLLLIVMLLSDALIGFYSLRLMAVVYLSFLAMVGIGYWVRKKVSVWRVGAGAVGGSVLFFLVTNFSVWAFSSWYPPTLEGLLAAYTMGLPFFKMTVLGNLFYSTLIFGAYELALIARKLKLGYTLPVRVKSGI